MNSNNARFPSGSPPDEPAISPAELRRVRIATLLGQSTEWYDFFLYTTAAALVFPRVFFSASFSPLAATLSSFATIAVGFVARPVGGALFGHLGDRHGRKKALVIALALMAAATLAIGLLPGFAAIGIAAPAALLVLRICQGLALGGQWGGAVLLATEYAPRGKRGAYGAWAQLGLPLGLIVSSAAFFVAAGATSADSFFAWGWRVPFLLGGALVVVALLVQMRIDDTPAFRRAAKRRGESHRSPVLQVIREHPRRIVVTIGVFLVVGGSFYVYTTGTLAYATQVLKISRNTMLVSIMIGAAAMAVSIVIASRLSDRVGRRPVFLVGAVGTILWAFPYFALLDSASPPVVGVAIAVAMFINGVMYGPTAALFSELFPVAVRYSGASLGYQLSNVVGGGFAPLVMTSLLASTGTSASVAGYVIVMGFITIGALLALRPSWSGQGDARTTKAGDPGREVSAPSAGYGTG
ncbi:MFS transporter [Amycolatopsis sp. NPDC005232]|uniref:MFS transporter n=1 Tax=Amycolatopsis sp. NPDC005232 TaxID=3157027 RepID=UPI0033A8E34C